MKQRNQRYPSQAPMLRILGNIALGVSIFFAIVILLGSVALYSNENPEMLISSLICAGLVTFCGFVTRVLFYTLAEYCEGFKEANFYLRKMNRGE